MSARQRARKTLSIVLGVSLSLPLVAGTMTPALADTATQPEPSATPTSEPSPEPTESESPSPDQTVSESTDPESTEAEQQSNEAPEPTDAEQQSGEAPESDEGLEPEAQQLQSEASSSGVVVSEITNGGPGGYHDNFIEITNTSDASVDVTGWEVFRCTGSGNQASAPQTTLEGEIAAGDIVLLAREHNQSSLTNDEVDYRYTTSFTNHSYGAIIRDADGELVDSVAVKAPSVSGDACAEGVALDNITNSAMGESWQRTQDTENNADDFILAPRTPGAENATEPADEPLRGDVLVSEIAHTDVDGNPLVEIGNYGDDAIDISGWTVGTCNDYGRHFNGYTYASAMPADSIAAGEALVVEMDANSNGFVDGAAGVILYDADGAVVDRVAMADGADSACADGEPLTYHNLDAEAGQSYQRTGSTGNNTDDFVAAESTPGQLEAGEPIQEDEEDEFLETTGGSNVLVSEMTNTGPEGNGDIFFELVNYGDEAQDLSGWSVYRCVGTGVRASVPQLSTEQLDGVVMEPGQRLTAGRSGQAGAEITAASDYFFDISFATQYGLIIFDDENRVVDRVGSARHDVESYCADGSPLPGDLSGLHGETWQRIDITGDAQNDFIAAPRTPGRVNATETLDHSVDSTVRFTEVTNGGPGGAGDNFVEITNTGDEAVDVTGWEMYRCTGSGRLYNDTLQFEMPSGSLEPGEVFVASRSGDASTVENPDIEYNTSFNADAGFGVMLVDGDLGIVDSVGVFSRVDSACTQGEPLPNNLDFATEQSYQRVADTGNNADDFIRATRTPGVHAPQELTELDFPAETEAGDLLINEVAGGGTNGLEDQFVELINTGNEPYDLSGYQLHYCSPDGRYMPASQLSVPEGTTLAPGSVLTVTGPGSDYDGDMTTGSGPISRWLRRQRTG